MADNVSPPPATESFFHDAILKLGGRRTLEVTGSVEGRETADWLLFAEHVIIEHKHLEVDFFAGERFRDKLGQRQQDFCAEGGNSQASSALGSAILREFDAYMSGVMKKANSQIKSSAELLGWKTPIGILVVANYALRDLPPKFIIMTIHRILRRKFSGIDGVVFLTDHWASRIDGDKDYLIRASIEGPRSRSGVLDVMQRIVTAFDDRLAEVTGEAAPIFKTTDRRVLDGLNADGARRRH